MIHKIREIRQAIDQKLYNCALALTLTLPDICAKVEYGKDPSWGSGQKYRLWFDSFAKEKFTYRAHAVPSNKIVRMNTVDGELCWALRCAVLHAGNYQINGRNISVNKVIQFHAHKQDGPIFEHELIDGDWVELDVIKFCKNICAAVEEYYNGIKEKSVFDIDEVKILDW